MKRLKALGALHRKVIHIEKAKASIKDSWAEERAMRKLSPTVLDMVCHECYGKMAQQALASESASKARFGK